MRQRDREQGPFGASAHCQPPPIANREVRARTPVIGFTMIACEVSECEGIDRMSWFEPERRCRRTSAAIIVGFSAKLPCWVNGRDDFTFHFTSLHSSCNPFIVYALVQVSVLAVSRPETLILAGYSRCRAVLVIRYSKTRIQRASAYFHD